MVLFSLLWWKVEKAKLYCMYANKEKNYICSDNENKHLIL